MEHLLCAVHFAGVCILQCDTSMGEGCIYAKRFRRGFAITQQKLGFGLQAVGSDSGNGVNRFRYRTGFERGEMSENSQDSNGPGTLEVKQVWEDE